MNCAFGAETFAVDTHIFRVGNRTGLASGKTVLAVEQKLEKDTPQPFRRHAHHWLILHGPYVCKARRPECWRCIVVDLCSYRPQTPDQIGRASCRERVCQSVYISVVDVSLKQKNDPITHKKIDTTNKR